MIILRRDNLKSTRFVHYAEFFMPVALSCTKEEETIKNPAGAGFLGIQAVAMFSRMRLR